MRGAWQVRVYRLYSRQSRQDAKRAIDEAPDGWQAKITLPRRSDDQNAKYHAMIGEIAKQAEHLGAKWEADDWKRLVLDKFARETGRSHGKVIPNLDKTGVVEVGIQSRKFNRQDGSDFIEWLHAWGAENGVVFDEVPWPEER